MTTTETETNGMFGTRVAAEREANGWDQSDLAEKLGCAPEHIRRVEKGGPVSIAHINQLAKIFGRSVSYLISGKE